MACCKAINRMGLVIAPEELALAYWQTLTVPPGVPRNQSLMQSPKVQFIKQLTTKGRNVYFREFMAAANSGLIFSGAWDVAPEVGLPNAFDDPKRMETP